MAKNIRPIDQDSSNIDFYKSLLKKLLKRWYLFVISLVASLSIGYFIYKSSAPQYRNNLLMLFSENNRNPQMSAGEMVQFGLFDIQSNIEDELGVLRSYPVINRTLKELNLIASYYIEEGLVTREVYKNTPFVVIIDPDYSQPVDLMFELKLLSNERYRLTAKSKDPVYLVNFGKNEITGTIPEINFVQEFAFGEDIILKDIKFKILLNGNYTPASFEGRKLFFKFNNLERLTYAYQGTLSVERISPQSSLVNLEMKGGSPILVTDFLNKLAEVYLDQNLAKKNRVATRTIKFIDDQIAEIADSLGFTATQLKDFRTTHNVMDINYLSQSVSEQMRELENQRAVLLVKSKYYDYIKEYFENNNDLTDLLAPSAMGVDDPQLTSLINQLTELNSQRSYFLDNQSIKNPQVPLLNAQINNLKKTILENIDYIVNTSQITIMDIDNRINKLKQEVNNLPNIEKELINIQREFQLNDAIYTFLLTKRSESQIARASNSPDYEIVDPSKLSSAMQVSPKKQMIYISAFFLGLMIPIGVVMLLSAFDDSINDKRDLEKLSSYPILGTIARNEKRSMLPIVEYPKSMIAESFRSVRTSLQFFHKGQPKKKVLVTSSMSGDGKTFIAMNLASAFSYFGKKTLLLEFDLRNPKIAEYLHINGEKGLSSYLINDARLEDIIQKTDIKNLDVIPTGQVPPNPVELIASDNTQHLIEILESIYDYIVIDTPPIGVVTDSFLIMDHSDANIFAVRLNYTNKKLYSSIVRDLEQKEIPNIAVIINDDEEKAQSVYYDDQGGKLSYIGKKINTLKSLIKFKKASST
jgi:tyrosine-protein kinase Etk/Wzc